MTIFEGDPDLIGMLYYKKTHQSSLSPSMHRGEDRRAPSEKAAICKPKENPHQKPNSLAVDPELQAPELLGNKGLLFKPPSLLTLCYDNPGRTKTCG